MPPPLAASPSVRSGAPRAFALGALLVVALLAAYWVALRGDFLWDDDLHVTANPTIIGPLGLKEIWTTARANYFPLVLTNFWVQHALWGLNPLGYHLVTLACHALAAILLWRVLRQLCVPGAWFGAALWALHPVQVESVAWICELKNTQSAVFFLASILFWLRWLEGRASVLQTPGSEDAGGGVCKTNVRRGAYALALLCALLAILSKPSTVMLPVALALCGWWRCRRLAWRDLAALAPFLALSAVAAGWTIWEQRVHSGAEGAEWMQTWPERLAIAGSALWFYLGKLAWPADLIFIYPRWSVEVANALSFAPLAAALAGIGFLAWRREGALRPVFAAAIFFGALLFPVLGFFSVYFFRYSYVGDHFQYLASMGPLALAGAGIAVALERLPVSLARLCSLLPVALLAVLGALTCREAAEYLSQETLWRATLTRNPDAFMAWANLGDTLVKQGRHREAMVCFRRALQLRPDDPPAHNDLGCELVLTGHPQAAISILERALRLKPGYAEVHNNLGNAFSRLGRSDDAVSHYEQAVKLKPGHAEAHNNLGCELVLKGRLPEAIARLEEAARLDPKSPKFHRDLGAALARTGRLPEAIVQFEQGIRLEPASVAVRAILGQALAQAGRWDEARESFAAGVRLAPNDADLHCNLAVAFGTLGKLPEAVVEFQHALRLRPGFIEAHRNLAQILRSLGRNLEAIDHFDEAERLQLQAARRR